MKVFCVFLLCVVLIAQENAEKLTTKIQAVEEILAQTEVANAPMEPDDTDLNEVARNINVNKCIMSFCVAYCRKMGYHRGVCIPPDTCDCYN